jgi:hypothetical protein
MKSRKIMLMALVMLAGMSTVILTSCGRIDPLETRCEALSDDVSAASDAFSANVSEATCEDLKESVLDYADVCAGYAGYSGTLHDIWSEVDCSIYNY